MVQRTVLQRRERLVRTDLGEVRCKEAQLPSGLTVLKPEEDELLRLLREHPELDRSTLLARLLPQLSR